ncbi:hypothetical protein AU099_gp92 [Gordonia phage GTE8]|uniref:Uncharacterized protein n=1 Tax=Gordonia phage GTE8 TaxID=1647475 RepID=A0A0K0N6I9_9CAUD|nr:hypothetical protein AU099_gp92 [Gordonia phage GTE8]AKJ72435.1 hypothetical protein GTE8_92 [Gordonia phage GTE8]
MSDMTITDEELAGLLKPLNDLPAEQRPAIYARLLFEQKRRQTYHRYGEPVFHFLMSGIPGTSPDVRNRFAKFLLDGEDMAEVRDAILRWYQQQEQRGLVR